MKNSRIAVIALTVVLEGAFPARAQAPTQDLLEALGRCATIADDHARLACYDAMSPRLKDALAAPPASLPGNRAPTAEEERSWFGFDLGNLFGANPAQQTTPQQFGSDRLPETKAKEETAALAVDSITAGVSEFAYNPVGKFILFLDNGQVWKQIEGDVDRAVFRKPAKDNKVTISRGFIGSYNLTINDSAKVFKVTRVK
ncbi:MAG TPA: hypothetical protein VNX86_01060 [Rhizomicrobium sp.]|jgi:hypothetical protein|nr:hypothetical protein [Rhizomicrobium sp.]